MISDLLFLSMAESTCEMFKSFVPLLSYRSETSSLRSKEEFKDCSKGILSEKPEESRTVLLVIRPIQSLGNGSEL